MISTVGQKNCFKEMNNIRFPDRPNASILSLRLSTIITVVANRNDVYWFCVLRWYCSLTILLWLIEFLIFFPLFFFFIFHLLVAPSLSERLLQYFPSVCNKQYRFKIFFFSFSLCVRLYRNIIIIINDNKRVLVFVRLTPA